MRQFFENMFFAPKWFHFFIIIPLIPFSLFYGSLMWLRRIFTKKIVYTTPIISVGNLIVGGSGKTPFVIALASRYDEVTIISRGYGRQSKGLIEVSNKGQILVSVEESGDEAMLMALSLGNASVIVSENRENAIALAQKKGTNRIILDDGFNRVNIKKFEILLEPECIKNKLPFPAGALREFYFSKKYANLVLKENRDFKRVVTIENTTERMLLVTAISNPKRLDTFLPKNIIGKIYLEDHAYFNKEELVEKMKAYNATSLLVTQKDAVKMQNFGIDLSVMNLKLKIENKIFKFIDK